MLRRHRTPESVNERKRTLNERGSVTRTVAVSVLVVAGGLAVGAKVLGAYEDSGNDTQARRGLGIMTDAGGDGIEATGKGARGAGVFADASGRTANDWIDREVVPWVNGESAQDQGDASNGGTDNGVPLAQLAEGSLPAQSSLSAAGGTNAGRKAYQTRDGRTIGCDSIYGLPQQTDDQFSAANGDALGGTNGGWIVESRGLRLAGFTLVNCGRQ